MTLSGQSHLKSGFMFHSQPWTVLPVTAPPDHRIEYFDLDSRTSTPVAELEDWLLGLSVSPDGSHLVCGLLDPKRGDLMLVAQPRLTPMLPQQSRVVASRHCPAASDPAGHSGVSS